MLTINKRWFKTLSLFLGVFLVAGFLCLLAPSDAQAEPELVITGTGLKEDVYLYQSDWLDFDNEDFIERYYSSVNNWNFYKIWRVRGWDLIDLLGEDNLKEGNWSIRFTASDGLSMAWTIDDLYGRYYYPEFSTDDGVQVGPMIAAYRAALFEPNYAGKPSEIEWEDRELTEADFDHEHPRVYMGQPEGEPEFKNQPFFIRKLVRIVVGEERPVPVTGVSITDGDQALEEGQTVQLNVVVEPSNAADKSVTWSSDNESVATVNEDGLVTAVGVGTATITVTTNEGNFTDSITVTVTEASSEPVVFTVAGDGVYGGLKEYTLSQLQAFGITTGEYIYTSSGQTVTDNCTGVLLAEVLADAGITDPTSEIDVVTADGYSHDSYSVTLQDVIDDAYLVTYMINDEVFEDKSKDGSKSSTIRIYRNYDDGSGWLNRMTLITGVEVTQPDEVPVTGVSIIDGDQALEEGQTVQLNVVVEPSNATNKSVTWSSDNESVATVNEDGLVTAVGVGTATITVTTNEGNFTDSITVTVTEASSEPVVFTVAGDGVYGGLKEYTLSQLQAFGITTGEYIYTSSGQTVTDNCTGVLLAEVLADAGITDPTSEIDVVTADGYSHDSYSVTLQDVIDDAYLVTYMINDEVFEDKSKDGSKSSTIRIYRNYDDGSGWLNRMTLITGVEVTQPLKPRYELTPVDDAAYVATIEDGINTMTVNDSISGFKYFTISIEPVIVHDGEETVVFTHLRNGGQLAINATRADFDIEVIDTAQAGFNVQPGDVIKVYVVNELSNSTGYNPIILQ